MTSCSSQTLTRTNSAAPYGTPNRSGIEPGSVVTPLELRCSDLDSCATREPYLPGMNVLLNAYLWSSVVKAKKT